MSKSRYEIMFEEAEQKENAQILAGAKWLLGLIQDDLDNNRFIILRSRQVLVEHETGSGSIRMSVPHLQESLNLLSELLTATDQPWAKAEITTGPAKHELQTKIKAVLSLR